MGFGVTAVLPLKVLRAQALDSSVAMLLRNDMLRFEIVTDKVPRDRIGYRHYTCLSGWNRLAFSSILDNSGNMKKLDYEFRLAEGAWDWESF